MENRRGSSEGIHEEGLGRVQNPAKCGWMSICTAVWPPAVLTAWTCAVRTKMLFWFLNNHHHSLAQHFSSFTISLYLPYLLISQLYQVSFSSLNIFISWLCWCGSLWSPRLSLANLCLSFKDSAQILIFWKCSPISSHTSTGFGI